ncbi:uncharacterized protein LOC104901473 [Beta vulgaris subsp. vulgaris]|uniref:uncharacterized protein LOC104901473 n=1 Tax=Beta vulgaris subsp. vulgaris TaxID=3555 RepID=UPI00053FFEF1|nr:uncharacterized protein LOC104901473 [Beta vulgaris subsp. vulgaris]
MDKFVIRKKARAQGGPSKKGPNFCNATSQNEEQVDLQNLPANPGERKRISDHPSKTQKAVKQKNLQMLAPSIQKDIVKACVVETIKFNIEELGDDMFGILVDESSDVSTKEQLAVVLHFVNDWGFLIARFLGVVHVANTCSISLKSVVESLLLEHGMSLSMIRGQGYDGASNMHGEHGGLKSLILKENKSSHYVHCFAHQLQLALLGTAKNHVDVIWFFDVVFDIINIKTGKRPNQQLGLKRLGDTRWGSHYRSLLNMVEMYLDLIEVLHFIFIDASFSGHRKNARGIMTSLCSFDFAFILHLMIDILGITNDLSLALQREYQDIVNAMHLLETSKKRLQLLRDDEFEELLEKLYQYCYDHDIDIPKMDDIYVTPGRSKRRAPQINFAHHYRVEMFYAIINLQLQDLNNRVNEINTKLLICVACLSPKDTFHAFDMIKLVRMAEFYPYKFDSGDAGALSSELRNYITNVRQRDGFQGLWGY